MQGRDEIRNLILGAGVEAVRPATAGQACIAAEFAEPYCQDLAHLMSSARQGVGLVRLIVGVRDGAWPQPVPHADALAQQGGIGADPRPQRPPIVVELANRDKGVIEQPPVTPFEWEDDIGRNKAAREPADVLPGSKILRCTVVLELDVFRDGLRDDPDPAHGPAMPGNPPYPLQPGPASIGWVRWFPAFPPPVGLILPVDGIGITELKMEGVPLKRVKQCVPLVSSQKFHADPSAGTS